MKSRHIALAILFVASIFNSYATTGENDLTTEEQQALQSANDDVADRLNALGSTISIQEPIMLEERRRAQRISTVADSAAEENASVNEDEEKTQRVKNKSVGYRVQIYADNNARTAKSEARNRERAIGTSFPAYSTYVSYASPYWRLRVGDFKSQYEAEKAAMEIKRAFPRYAKEVRVVRDRINNR